MLMRSEKRTPAWNCIAACTTDAASSLHYLWHRYVQWSTWAFRIRIQSAGEDVGLENASTQETEQAFGGTPDQPAAEVGAKRPNLPSPFFAAMARLKPRLEIDGLDKSAAARRSAQFEVPASRARSEARPAGAAASQASGGQLEEPTAARERHASRQTPAPSPLPVAPALCVQAQQAASPHAAPIEPAADSQAAQGESPGPSAALRRVGRVTEITDLLARADQIVGDIPSVAAAATSDAAPAHLPADALADVMPWAYMLRHEHGLFGAAACSASEAMSELKDATAAKQAASDVHREADKLVKQRRQELLAAEAVAAQALGSMHTTDTVHAEAAASAARAEVRAERRRVALAAVAAGFRDLRQAATARLEAEVRAAQQAGADAALLADAQQQNGGSAAPCGQQAPNGAGPSVAAQGYVEIASSESEQEEEEEEIQHRGPRRSARANKGQQRVRRHHT